MCLGLFCSFLVAVMGVYVLLAKVGAFFIVGRVAAACRV
jgi:hypothetical protein